MADSVGGVCVEAEFDESREVEEELDEEVVLFGEVVEVGGFLLGWGWLVELEVDEVEGFELVGAK